jgi:hypothetical protein
MSIGKLANDYFALDYEIKQSGQVLSQMRKRKQDIGNELVVWLQKHNKKRIITSAGVLERKQTTSLQTVNQKRVEEVANRMCPQIKEQFVRALYDKTLRAGQIKETLYARKARAAHSDAVEISSTAPDNGGEGDDNDNNE